MKTCSKCEKEMWAKGLCGTHYARHWYQNNPSRAREIARDAYHAKNPGARTREEIAAARPVSCADCGRDRVLAKGLCGACYRMRFYREADVARKAADRKSNPEKSKAAARAYHAANPEKARAATAAWWAAHPGAQRVKDATRRARKAGAGGRYTSKDIQRLMALQKSCCAVCHADISKKHHRDHNMPLALGGSNSVENIQLLCPPCNQSKHHRHPVEFMQSRGFLL